MSFKPNRHIFRLLLLLAFAYAADMAIDSDLIAKKAEAAIAGLPPEVRSLIDGLSEIAAHDTADMKKNISAGITRQIPDATVTRADNEGRPFSAYVSRVNDGDTITVRTEGNQSEKVRLYGIDSPELDQPYGARAKAELQAIAGGKTIRLIPMYRDQYGRIVAIPEHTDGTSILLELIESGSTWVYENFCREEALCSSLRAAQRRAKAMRKGLWAQRSPVYPRNWRKTHPKNF